MELMLDHKESIADPNRCLLPADILTPARRDRVAFERDKLAVSSANCGDCREKLAALYHR